MQSQILDAFGNRPESKTRPLAGAPGAQIRSNENGSAFDQMCNTKAAPVPHCSHSVSYTHLTLPTICSV